MILIQLTRPMVLVAAIAFATACSPVIRNHGYVPIPEDLALLSVGVDTRETVIAAVGPPTSGGVLNESGFYYVASQFRHFGALEPRETERQVVAISFDGNGLVSNIERFGLEDGQVVALSRRVTDSPVQDSTFLRQLLGNLGRFDTTGAFGES